MRRLFCDGPLTEGAAAILSGEDLHHIKNVLRMKPGQTIDLTDPSGATAVGTVAQTPEGFAVLCGRVTPPPKADAAQGALTLYMGLAKGDKFDFVVQKAVELGAQTIVPVAFCRSVVRLREADAQKKCVRWNKIAKEAAMQSGAAVPAQVTMPKTVAQVCEQIAGTKTLLAYELERRREIGDALFATDSALPLGLIVGPEGGIDPQEAAQLTDAGAVCVSLGRRILRCETAPLVLLSVAQFVRGGLQAPHREEI